MSWSEKLTYSGPWTWRIPAMKITRTAVSLIFIFASFTSAQSPICSVTTLSIVPAGDYYNWAPVAPSSLVSILGANIATGVSVASDQSPAILPIVLGGVGATMTDASGNTLPISLL